jgi:hypothetical protein
VKRSELVGSAQPEALTERVAEQGPRLRRQDKDHDHGHGHGHGMPVETTREATYRGHHILVRTTYQIEVDGTPIYGHLGVTNDGQVHYHAVPNLAFASAVDLVRQLIDTFPDDFEPETTTYAHGRGA